MFAIGLCLALISGEQARLAASGETKHGEHPIKPQLTPEFQRFICQHLLWFWNTSYNESINCTKLCLISRFVFGQALVLSEEKYFSANWNARIHVDA